MYTPNTAQPKRPSTRFLSKIALLRGLLGTVVALAIPVALVATDGPRGSHLGTAVAAENTESLRKAPVVNSTSALGPSLVSVSGRQVLVRKRNPDGTLGAAAPYIFRGVDWSPASKGTNTSKNDPNNATVRRPEFGLWAATDIPLMKAMNVNTVYIYIDPGLDANGTAVLDQLYANDIMVVMTVDDGINNLGRVQQAVSFYKDHPAVLAWMLGNEWNINRYFTNPQISAAEAAQRTETAAALIKTLDSNHPVATSYGDIDIAAFGMQLADTQNYVNNVCHSVDIWGLNIFRGNTFGTLFDQWQVLTSKPMFLGEFGTDAFRSVVAGSVTGSVDGIGQAHWDLSEWNHLVKNLSAQDPAKVAVGGFAFEWADEWWKVQPYGSQETNGFILMGGHPDDYASEEYFGVVDIDRNPRPLYYALKTAFEATYQLPQSVTFRAASRGSTAEEFSFQHGVALFFKDGQIFYRANGGAGDGRGFNVAAIDPCTNALLHPVQHFDTWFTRSSGTGLNEMMGFLDSLPNGTLILIAVADEAGLNQFPPNDCQHLTNPYIEAFFQKLEGLGSHQIRSYCYWSSWAMVTVKGEGQARGEQLISGSEASAEGTQLRSAVLSPSGQSFGANGGNNSIGVSTLATCAWTATSDNSFVTVVPPGSGSGNGTVNYTVAANTDNIPRVATLTVAGQPFVVSQSAPNQNVQVTVQTNPSGRTFTVDGTTYSGAQTFGWTPGSSHTISTTSPQSGGSGTQYVWSSWSDGGGMSHSVAPSSTITYTANFTTQYFLTMNAGGGGTVSPSSGFFNSGAVVSISATPNANFVFSGWTGSGPGSFTGATNPASVTMNGPISEVANFTQNSTSGDFDGDGKADLAVWRPSSGVWFIINSTGSQRIQGWGTNGDVPAPADYDGDRRTDLAIYRPSTRVWYILNSSNGSTRIQSWGLTDDVPVPGDYDGDGKADIAVWRPSSGQWYIINSSNGSQRIQGWGTLGDIPVPGDYDGDGKSDTVVWRPSSGQWFIINSSNSSQRIQGWGTNGDLPIGADYDGDGKADLAVFRPSSGVWYIVNSLNNSQRIQGWGTNGDIPVASDYDGDAKRDIAVWRPSSGTWYIINSLNNSQRVQGWGMLGDVPVSGALIIR